MADAAILPCPFCASTNVRVDNCGDEVFRKITCECGASGPVRGTEDEDEEHGHNYAAAARRDAIAAWNTAVRGSALRKTSTPRSAWRCPGCGFKNNPDNTRCRCCSRQAPDCATGSPPDLSAIWARLSDPVRDAFRVLVGVGGEAPVMRRQANVLVAAKLVTNVRRQRVGTKWCDRVKITELGETLAKEVL